MPNSSNWIQTLAKHDTAIEHLGSEVRTLKSEVHQGFSSINTGLVGLTSKLDRLDAAPRFDLRGTLGVVKDVAILFTMTVAGIIWIIHSLNAGNLARADILTAEEARAITELKDRVKDLEAWRPVVKKD